MNCSGQDNRFDPNAGGKFFSLRCISDEQRLSSNEARQVNVDELHFEWWPTLPKIKLSALAKQLGRKIRQLFSLLTLTGIPGVLILCDATNQAPILCSKPLKLVTPCENDDIADKNSTKFKVLQCYLCQIYVSQNFLAQP